MITLQCPTKKWTLLSMTILIFADSNQTSSEKVNNFYWLCCNLFHCWALFQVPIIMLESLQWQAFPRHHTTTTNQTMAKMAAAILLHIAIISRIAAAIFAIVWLVVVVWWRGKACHCRDSSIIRYLKYGLNNKKVAA